MVSNRLPEHLKRWVSDKIVRSLPQETHLNCVGCTRYKTKCCAFQPYIANFIAEYKGVSRNYLSLPIGIVATADYQKRYFQSTLETRGDDLLCVNYSAGRCLTWDTRPAECASFFCEPVNIAIWENYSIEWNKMESVVAQKIMLRLGFSLEAVERQAAWISDPIEEIDIKSEWGKWWTRENDFYLQSRELALTINPSDPVTF